MKTKNEQLKSLKQALQLITNAYYMQNKAKVIINENYEVDDDLNFLENDFYKLTKFKTSKELYDLEVAIQNLINKIENQ